MTKIKKYSIFLESFFGIGAKKDTSYYYSSRFRLILKAIAASGDTVAQNLIYAEDSNQVRDDITFIDIGSTESVVSFIQLNRLSKIAELENDVNKSKWTVDDIVRYRWRNSQDDLSSKGWTDQRTEISIGRFVNRVFQKAKVTSSPDRVEKFVNLYKSRIKMSSNIDDVFEIVKGEDIRKWYLEDNYSSGRGQLANSCMRYERCQKYLDIYVKNTDVCQLLIIKDEDGKLLGRSLIWKLTDGKYYMDRQYTNIDADMELYKEYAKKNGWRYYDDKDYKEIRVQLTTKTYDCYPYMDSFVVYNYKDGILSTNGDLWGESNNGWWKLQNTNGTYTSDKVVYSDYNDEYLPMEDAVYCDDISDWVRPDQAIYVEYKERYYWSESDEVCWSDYHSQYYLVEDAIFSEYMQDWLDANHVITCYVSSIEEIDIPDDMINMTKKVDIDGDKICLINAIMIDPFTDKWIFKLDKIKLYYCEDNNTYVSEEDSQGLNIDKGNIKLETKSNYIISKIVDVDINDLIKYLQDLKLNNDIKEKMEKYSLPIKPIDVSFQLVKLAIILLSDDSNRNAYFKYKNVEITRGIESHNKSLFLEFIDEDTYKKITRVDWTYYLKFADIFLYDIITDKKILKVYTALKFIQKS